jgi:hypothetical protein
VRHPQPNPRCREATLGSVAIMDGGRDEVEDAGLKTAALRLDLLAQHTSKAGDGSS